jgi:uncharacterized protein YecT (DUF1311 family)
MKAISGIAAIVAIFISTPALAAGCDGPKTGFDNVYCFAKIYMELDRQLTENYVSLMRSIPPRQQSILREGQRAWISQRDGECYNDHAGAQEVNIDCALRSTRDRVQFLSDRAAECRARGCSESRLGGLRGNP